MLRKQLEVIMKQHEEVVRQADHLVNELNRVECEEESLKRQAVEAIEEKAEVGG